MIVDLILPVAALLGLGLMVIFLLWAHPRRRSQWDRTVTDTRSR